MASCLLTLGQLRSFPNLAGRQMSNPLGREAQLASRLAIFLSVWLSRFQEVCRRRHSVGSAAESVGVPDLFVRPRPALTVAVHQDELLNALPGIDFACVEVPARINRDRVNPVEVARHAPVITDRAGDRAALA